MNVPAYLVQRGWREEGNQKEARWWPPSWLVEALQVPHHITAADKLQSEADAESLAEHGSVRYVPTVDQARKSPLCAALAEQDSTEHEVIEHLFMDGQRLLATVQTLALHQLPAPTPDAAPPGMISLYEVPTGAIFETADGVRAVRSEYCYPNGGVQCVLLASGEYAHFAATARAHNATLCRIIDVDEERKKTAAWKELAIARGPAGGGMEGLARKLAAVAALRALGIDPEAP